MSWNNRIVEYGESAPDDLLANPHNWRVHPDAQAKALTGALDSVGWVAPVIVNQRTGFVVDGHLRVAMAISADEPSVPVAYVDLSDEEEALVLATFDPITEMAVADESMLAALTAMIEADSAALRSLDNLLGEPVDVLGDTEPVAPTPQEQVALTWGYATFGKTKVNCSAGEVDALQSLYDGYRAEHGDDIGFVRWLTGGIREG